MSLFRTLDRTSAVLHHHHHHHYYYYYAPLLPFLYPSLHHAKTPRRSFSHAAVGHVSSPTSASAAHVAPDDLFIRALVRAASCRSNRHPPDRRGFKTRPEHKGPLSKAGAFARKELKAMVDYYGIDIDTRPDHDAFLDHDGPLIWNVGDDHEPWPLRDPADYFYIRRLKKLLKDDETPHHQVFDAYKKLPSPGVVYLDTDTIRTLLHHLSVVERPSPPAMQRFMSVLDDMKTAHIHINQSEWTTAIYFAGRCMGIVSAQEVAAALHTWRDMEHRAGVKGGFVTLNVLFDVAVKANKFTLAETFLKEMQARNLKLHRHFRISLIYYHGVLQNGNAVRQAYQDLVDAGDIVDTVVMNAVVAALFRAGEPAAAEHVFDRMKRLHAAKPPLAAPGHRFFLNNWRDRRAVGLHFTHQSRLLQREKKYEELTDLQSYAPIAPNSRTYSLLIRHHSTVTGDIDRVNDLLQEMHHNSVPVEGTAYIVMFQGFASFGGIRYSSWTPDRLEKVWLKFRAALANKTDRTWLSSLAVVTVLRAFKRCTTPERAMTVWEDIQPDWHPNEQELESVMQELRRIDVKPGFFSKNVRGRIR